MGKYEVTAKSNTVFTRLPFSFTIEILLVFLVIQDRKMPGQGMTSDRFGRVVRGGGGRGGGGGM